MKYPICCTGISSASDLAFASTSRLTLLTAPSRAMNRFRLTGGEAGDGLRSQGDLLVDARAAGEDWRGCGAKCKMLCQ